MYSYPLSAGRSRFPISKNPHALVKVSTWQLKHAAVAWLAAMFWCVGSGLFCTVARRYDIACDAMRGQAMRCDAMRCNATHMHPRPESRLRYVLV